MMRKQIIAFRSSVSVVTSELVSFARRATIESVDVDLQNIGQQCNARVKLHYSFGPRPWSVIIDIIANNGASGSVTLDGEQERVVVPLSTSFEGMYTLTATATYCFLGIPRIATSSYTGTLLATQA